MAVRNGTSGLFNEEYSVNNIENAATTYIGKVSPGGRWMVQRYVDATGLFDYANRSNNTAVTTYSDTWTGRAGLTYAAFETLTGV